MRFVAVIILFSLAVGGSSLLAKLWLRGSVEAEMERRAGEVLSNAGFEGVEVKFDHLNGSLNGYVESPSEMGAVVVLLKEKLPTAYWPGVEETGLTIRPTLKPWLRVTRVAGSDKARVEGVLSADEETGRTLLGSRLHALPGIGEIDNAVSLDPMHLAFPKMAEFASLASGVLAHSDAAEISFKDGGLKIVGTVPNDGIKAGLIELAREIGDSGTVDEISVKMPDTFLRFSELKITRNRFGITLTGFLPSEQDRASLISIFKGMNSNTEIFDRIEVSNDRAGALWQAHLPSIIPALLSGLSGEMTAEFANAQIRLHGAAPNEESLKTVEAGLASFVTAQTGIEVVMDISTETQGLSDEGGDRFLATYDGKVLVLTGILTDESIISRIEEKLGDVIPGLSVRNEIVIDPAISGGEWISRLPEFFAEALRRVTTGRFNFDRNRLEMQGLTIALSDRQVMQNIAVNTVPATYTIDNQLLHADQPVPKQVMLPEVREQIGASMKELPVYFDKNSEIIKSEEKEKVASIAEMLKKTGGAFELVVTGFSDSVGNAESNRQLSLRRADAVVQELARLEIPEATMITASIVEDESRLSRNERWKARRVEVSLKPSSAGDSARSPNP